MRSTFFIAVAMIYNLTVATGQEVNAWKTVEPVQVDGFLNEADWLKAPACDRFYQFEPEYDQPATFKTVVQVMYDASTLYVAFTCHDPDPSKITAKETKRDGRIADDDVVGFMIDTFNDGSNGYIFMVNPLGTQGDGRLADNGRTEDYQWDETWESACRITETGWTAEIALPLKSIKFNRKSGHWGFNAGRKIARLREGHYLVKGLTNAVRVSQFGRLSGLDFSQADLKQYAVIPFVQTQFAKNQSPDVEAGLDLRFNPVPQLGVEATINPDFATIEADVEQVNLTRYELSYPEKRPFFLEGAENYSTRIRQFYSRRIGEIPWGAKVSGKVKAWKIHGLATRSDPSTAGSEDEAGHALYTVFRVSRDMPKGSNVGFIGANRHYDGQNSGSLGLAATLFFTDVLGMTSQVIRSHGTADQGIYTWFLRPAYDSQFMHFHLRYSHYGQGVKENMNAIGFIRHDDRREFDTNIRRTFWINRWGLDSVRPSINYNRILSQQNTLRSWDADYELEAAFLKKFELELEYEKESYARYAPYYEKDFMNHNTRVELSFDNKRGWALSVELNRGRNFDQDLESLAGGVELNPVKGWNMEYEFERLWLKPAGPDDNTWIHYLRSSYYLNKDLFFKLFYQTKYELDRRFWDADFDLSRKTLQLVFVWRFLPPFGSLQLAYQEGQTRMIHSADGEDEKGRTLFTKFSWVF